MRRRYRRSPCAPMTSLLSARVIDKRFGGASALTAAHFDLAAGEVHALMGENGAGKSTLPACWRDPCRPMRAKFC